MFCVWISKVKLSGFRIQWLQHIHVYIHANSKLIKQLVKVQSNLLRFTFAWHTGVADEPDQLYAYHFHPMIPWGRLWHDEPVLLFTALNTLAHVTSRPCHRPRLSIQSDVLSSCSHRHASSSPPRLTSKLLSFPPSEYVSSCLVLVHSRCCCCPLMVI